MNQALFFYSTNHWISKNNCSPIIFMTLLLLVHPVQAPARTARTAESMVGKKNQAIGTHNYQTPRQTSGTSRKTEEMVSGSSTKQHQQSLITNTTKKGQDNFFSHTSQAGTKHTSTPRKYDRAQHVVNGVKLEILSCKYVPEYKSVTCDFKATNLEPDIEAVMYCYTGTEAVDDTGNKLQCAHVWLGSNHSWNYAHGKLMKGTPVKGMIRLETRRAPKKLKALKVSIALNGATESAMIKNIPVR